MRAEPAPAATSAPAGAAAPVVEIFSGLQGEGIRLGERMVFVRLAGCDRRCAYCDTPRAREIEGAETLSAGEVAARARARAAELPHAAVAWTGGEPLVHVDFLVRALPLLREIGLAQYLETNGTRPDALARVIDLVDAVAADVKLPSVTGEALDWEKSARFLALAAPRELLVKIVVSEATDEAELARAVALASDAGAPVVLQPVTPVPGGPRPPSAEATAAMQAAALAHHARARVRVIPQVHRLMGWR